MLCKLRWVALAVALGVVCPALARDDKKDGDKKPASNSKPEPPKEKMVPAGQVEGKVVRVEAGKKILAIKVKLPYLNGRNVAYHDKDVEYTAADEVQVLLANLPVELDEKGRPKKPNPKDLKKAVKGPGGIKGFPADFDALHSEQVVRLYLVKKKEAYKSPRQKKEEALEDNKPLIGTVFVIVEPPPK